MTAEAETDWPYDADEHDPLTALRIPVVGSAWPRWNYIVAFDSGELDGEQTRPDERETAMLRLFLDEYIARWYSETWKARLAERPFDIDGGANGVTFRKWGPDDWGYRRRTWQYGPTYVPGPPRWRAKNPDEAPGPLNLEQVMDRIHTVLDDEPAKSWVEWKAAHPNTFGGAR
jgi:hypothetical protein